jgi:hypothetical protein
MVLLGCCRSRRWSCPDNTAPYTQAISEPEVRSCHPPARHGRLHGPRRRSRRQRRLESFFSLLQKNILNRRTWTTREQLRIAIVTWIEKTTTADADNTPSAA